MKVFLIRHGESIQNIGASNNLPDPDIYLTETGKEQVKETGQKLKQYVIDHNLSLNNARMWVSPYLRTEETANIILQHIEIKSVYQDPRLVEKDFGIFDGIDEKKWEALDPVTIGTVRKRYDSERSRFFSRLPNGESPFDVYNRISSFIETLYRDNNNPIFIVTHGDTIKCFIMRFLHKDIKWYYAEETAKNADVILIEQENNQYCYKKIIK